MRTAALVLAFSLATGSAFAGTCPQMTPNNVFITWASSTGGCSQLGGVCNANDLLAFDVQPFGFSFACSVYTVQWDFGDGTTARSKAATHRYATAGKYSVSVRLQTAEQSLVVTSTVDVSSQSRRRVVRKPPPPPPLDESTLQSVILEYGGVEMQPGESRHLQLLRQQCCVYFEPVIADARFSLDPTPFATIDPDGILTVSPTAPGGISIRAYADIEDGRRIVSTDVYIDTPESNPLRGSWLQTAEIPCYGGPEIAATTPALSLDIRAGNRFDAVWIGFEVYKDYWGLYTFNRTAGTATFGVQSGNYVPSFMRGEGTFAITNEGGWKVLRLNNIWLGRPRGDTRQPGCGMVFRGERW